MSMTASTPSAGSDTNVDVTGTNINNSGVDYKNITKSISMRNRRRVNVDDLALPLFLRIRKLTILTCVALTTTVLNTVILNCVEDSRIGIMVKLMTMSVDALFNGACLVLQFGFASKIYNNTFKCLENVWLCRSFESFVNVNQD